MKHAYLIIAHSNWKQLILLLQLLDDDLNDIYIHIDKKVKNFPEEEVISAVKKSKIRIFQEYKVYWGSFELVQTELLLFKEAHKFKYDYYHLLSGADLPIKSQKYIHDFFEKNAGCEFVHFDTDKRLENDNEIKRRTKLYHFFQNYRRRFKFKIVNSVFTLLERVLLVFQILLNIDRNKKHPNLIIKYGSQWVSITDDLVSYILDNESLIYDVFHCTNCSDELFIQTLVYNSNFKNNLYNKNFDNSVISNMRLIDWNRGNNGNPYIWKSTDLNEIIESPCLFARKFNLNVDNNIINVIKKNISN